MPTLLESERDNALTGLVRNMSFYETFLVDLVFGSSEKGALQTLGIVLGSLHGSGAVA